MLCYVTLCSPWTSSRGTLLRPPWSCNLWTFLRCMGVCLWRSSCRRTVKPSGATGSTSSSMPGTWHRWGSDSRCGTPKLSVAVAQPSHNSFIGRHTTHTLIPPSPYASHPLLRCCQTPSPWLLTTTTTTTTTLHSHTHHHCTAATHHPAIVHTFLNAFCTPSSHLPATQGLPDAFMVTAPHQRPTSWRPAPGTAADAAHMARISTCTSPPMLLFTAK